MRSPVIDIFLLTVGELAPDNAHPMPIAESWDGVKWTVDIQIRTSELDIDGTGIDADIIRARAKAVQRIRKTKTMFERYGYVPN